MRSKVGRLPACALLFGLLVSSGGCRGLASYAPAADAAPADAADAAQRDIDRPLDLSHDRLIDVARDAAEDAPDRGAEFGVDQAVDADAATDADFGPDTMVHSCDQLFGAAPGYLFCSATATTCRFYYVSPVAVSCGELCGNNGCLKHEDNIAANDCTAEVPNICGSVPCTCASAMLDSICTCNL